MTEPNGEDRSSLKPRSFTIISASLIGNKKAALSHWNVAAALCLHADASGKCFPKQETLVEYTGFSRRQINYAINDLIAWGLVERIGEMPRNAGRKGATIYRVIRQKHDLDLQEPCATQTAHGPSAMKPENHVQPRLHTNRP